ncbi:MAG: DUF2326 domain-containing protein, partial [Bifidobacteriaceae bacterium]|nr:DUF2326 domain-containing protein [Bifidobacteriaceae bacterium]
ELEDQVGRFEVLPEYHQLSAQADAADKRIRQTVEEDGADKRNSEDLRRALLEENDPDIGYLERIYSELGLELPEAVLRSYADVAAFNASVLSNRRAYLKEELEAVSGRLVARQEERDRLDLELQRLLARLNQGGALDALTALQDRLSVQTARTETIEERLKAAQQLQDVGTQIKTGRAALESDMVRDLREREDHIAEINLLFQRFAAALYGPGRDAYLEFTPSDKALRIVPFIGGEQSRGIGNMRIFCFDFTVAVAARRSGRGPDLLVHDSHLFDGVYQRQVAAALAIAETTCREEGLQYVATINSDQLAKAQDQGCDFGASIIEPRLTDAYQSGGLFGFRFD